MGPMLGFGRAWRACGLLSDYGQEKGRTERKAESGEDALDFMVVIESKSE